MKKIRYISMYLAILIILWIIIEVVVSDRRGGEKQELELVKQEVSEEIKRNMEKAVAEGNFSDYLEPSEVSFIVKDVYKEDVLRYGVKIVFIAKTDKKLNDIQMKEAARDMESLFREFKTVWGKWVTVCSQRGNGGIVSVINGKVVEQVTKNGESDITKMESEVYATPYRRKP